MPLSQYLYVEVVGEIRPVFCGSAVNLSGVSRLMSVINKYFPTYAEAGLIEGFDKVENVVKMATAEDEKFSAFVFKTIIDPFVGRISFIKIMSGVLSICFIKVGYELITA